MIRRVLLGSAALLFSGAVVCAGVVGWGVFRLAFGMPGVEEGTRQVTQLRPWGIAFLACTVTGFVTLWFVRDRGGPRAVEPDTAPDHRVE
jgi:hypothetical protein